jgi:endonuclease G
LPLEQLVVPADQIEIKTGIDFFPGIEDNLEEQLEGSLNKVNWGF